MAKIKKKNGRAQSDPGQEIRSIADGMMVYYRQYAKQFNTALTVLVVALLASLLFNFISAGKERKAGQMFDAAYSFYAPAGAASPDYPRSLQGFQEVVKQYGGTLNGALAQYYIGNALMGMDRTGEAVTAYEEFLKRYAGKKDLVGMVYQRMGYAYLALGNREEAVKAFTKAETAAGAGPSTLELARLYERMGNAEDAQRKYKEVSEKLPATSLALEARTKLPPPDLQQPLGTPRK